MTDKEFRRLSRADMIEIIYELQQSEKMLQKENEDLKRKLEDRRVTVSEAGSLAEVLARLNGLFEAAQTTADDYRNEAERLLEEARHTREQADDYLADMKRQAANLASLTIQQRKDMHAKTEAEEDAQRSPRPQQRDGEGLDPDAIPHPVKEGR